MIPRSVLITLVYVLALVMVALGVIMVFYLVTQATQDSGAQLVLRWCAAVLAVVGVVDLVLLVAVLAIDVLQRRPPDDPGQRPV